MKNFRLKFASAMLAMFLGGYSSATAQNYDLNGDGTVDVADMSALISHMAGNKQSGVILNRVQTDAAKSKLNESGAKAVDLGLPSGRKWADRNIGFTKDNIYGVYFAWGGLNWVAAKGQNVPGGHVLEKGVDYDGKETAFNWKNYEWINSGRTTWRGISKYQIPDGVKDEGTDDVSWYDDSYAFTGDGMWALEDGDDAAKFHWGAKWRLPYTQDFEELLEYTDQVWDTDKKELQNGKKAKDATGVWGCWFYGKSSGRDGLDWSKSEIFLPAAGDIEYQYVEYREGQFMFPKGFYWSKQLDSHFGHDSSQASILYISRQHCCEDEPNNKVTYYERQYGLSIRPVADDE